MSYMILTYGSYDAPEDEYDISTEKKAMNVLHRKIKKWCKEHDVDIDDTDYCDVDDIFTYGEDEKGVCVIAIFRIPIIKNEADQCLWDAKIEMEKAYFASEDYKWTLMGSSVDCHVIEAQRLIDRAKELMGGWQYDGK